MSAVLVDLGGVVPASGTTVLAQDDSTPPPGKGPEFGKASPVGLVVVLLLAVATLILIRSMSKRIRRLPASFDDPPSPAAADRSDDRSDDAGAGRA